MLSDSSGNKDGQSPGPKPCTLVDKVKEKKTDRPSFLRHNLPLMLALFLFLPTSGLAKNSTPFPLYPIIKPNVQFWVRVYGTYTSRQGILHDKNDLSIIYGIVDFIDWNTPGAARINKNLIKLARHRFKKILNNLGHGQRPKNREEKRIAALFAPQKRSRFLRARDNIRLQIGQKDRFLKGVIRSGAYIHRIEAIFRHYRLPAELAYLPHVESSFNPRAQSKAGAVGLWQFTRGTGRDFMTINHLLDERYDPFISSRAAARLLKKNYTQLKSWPLALTAYNYGRAGMVRALHSRKTYEKIFKNHHTRLFKFSSRNFYSEFLAALHVAKRLEKKRSVIRDRPPATITIRLKGYCDARSLRRYFRLSREDFSHYNPALRSPVLTGKKYIPRGYRLRLPATRFIRKKAAEMGNRFYHSRQIPDHFYTVRRGDTIGSIGRRFHVAPRELIRINHLDSRATIRIGQKLILEAGGYNRSTRNRKRKRTRAERNRVQILQDKAKLKP